MDDPSTNFCGLLHQAPARVSRVKSAAQAADLIRACRSRGEAVNLRGAGHGSGDRNIGPGTLLVNTLPPRIERVNERIYRVSSATSWLELERTLNAQGRAAPVLTNWPAVSVGGTMAAGGFGSASIEGGAQTDWLCGLHAILPDGSEVSLDRADPRFPLMSCALGVHGFVTEVELETRLCPGPLSWSGWQYSGFEAWIEALAEGLRVRPADTEHLLAQARWGAFGFTMATRRRFEQPLVGAMPILDEIDHAAWREGLTRRSFAAGVVNPWSDFVLPATALAAFLSDLLADLAEENLREGCFPRLRILFVDLDRAPTPRALYAPHRGMPGHVLAGVGVYFVLNRNRAVEIAAARGVLRRSLERCARHGGRPYLPSWHEMSRAELSVFYPDAVRASNVLRTQDDPNQLFNPGRIPPI